MKYTSLVVLSFLLLAGVAQVGNGGTPNVDLVTLPRRDSVQLTIYNSEDLTLVKETRFVTFKQGKNRLQFSWAGTLIDPTSVQLRVLAEQERIEVLDTVFPGQKPQHLIWNIESDFEGQAPVEVSYFTSGLTWRMDYVAIADAPEQNLDFRGHVRVFNNSGEAYENAEIRLIVGKINLVEKIAELAQQLGISGKEQDEKSVKERLRRDVTLEAFNKAEWSYRKGISAATKKIVKEGVSEYFMFSIPGQESIDQGWSKRMQSVSSGKVAFEIVYRMRDYQYGPRPVRFFLWDNEESVGLGDSPLPNGQIRVFRRDDQGRLSFLGQQTLHYVPIQAKVEVNLGADDLVVYERRRADTGRSDFAFHPRTRQVTGWNERQQWIDSVRNHRAEAIRLELRMRWNGDVQYQAPGTPALFDYNTVETKLQVPSRGRAQAPYTATIHQGANAKQNRIKIIPFSR